MSRPSVTPGDDASVDAHGPAVRGTQHGDGVLRFALAGAAGRVMLALEGPETVFPDVAPGEWIFAGGGGSQRIRVEPGRTCELTLGKE